MADDATDEGLVALRRRLALLEAENRVLRSGQDMMLRAAAPVAALASRVEDGRTVWVGVEAHVIRGLARAAVATRAAGLATSAGRRAATR